MLVQHPIAAVTRTVAFDNAGFGFSDTGPPPRTASAMVNDLGAALWAADIPPPYVLAGWSWGGLVMRLADARLAGADLRDGDLVLLVVAEVVGVVEDGLPMFQHLAQPDLRRLPPKLGSPDGRHAQLLDPRRRVRRRNTIGRRSATGLETAPLVGRPGGQALAPGRRRPP